MDLADFDLNLLKTLNALLAERHVTRAAEILGRSQPAVSNALQRLRDGLGDELLVRGPRGLVLTPRAEQLQPVLRELLALIEESVFSAAPFDPATAEGLFRISMPDRLSITLLPPLLARLQLDAPRMNLDVVTADRDHALQLLNDQEVDIAVGLIDEAPPHLHAELLFEEKFVCVMRRSHPILKSSQRFTMASVLSYPHLAVSARRGRTQIFDDLLARQGFKRRVVVTLTNFTAVAHLLKRGDMIGVFTRLAAEAFVKFGMATRPMPVDVGTITTNMIWHARNSRSPTHIWMREQIKAVYDRFD